MKRARRQIPALGLSFLDTMFSGFGAVILVYLLINHSSVVRSDNINEQLITSVNSLENRVLDGRQNVMRLQAALTTTRNAERTAQSEAERLRRQTQQEQSALRGKAQSTDASRSRVIALQAELKTLETQVERLRAQVADASANATRQIAGEGKRQYLTGLKVGGQRVLILVDASASMLGETIVEAVRRRNMDDASRRTAPKWQRALAIADWLSAHVPAASRFQLYVFNETARAAIAGSERNWLVTDGGKRLTEAMNALRQVIPEKGTSLYAAIAAAAALQPPPDNVYLITDGLPTQGSRVREGTVSGPQRLEHFNEAAKALPPNVPMNVILLPMEGDPQAVAAFWQLSRLTGGSYITPSRDWP